jgi:membrane-bound serine protease (ClpP class)
MKKSRSTTTGTERLRRGASAALMFAGLALALLPSMAEEDTGADAGVDGEATAAEAEAAPRAMMLTVDGAIGPATRDYISRGIEDAAERDFDLVILKLDTPGGLVTSTRDIVKEIRGSSVPFATWVAPGGARAASAGTYILYASHVAAMAPATNVGAATPVSIGGGGAPAPSGAPDADAPPEEQDKGQGESEGEGADGGAADGGVGEEGSGDGEQPGAGGDAKTQKALNDAAAWIRGLAQETGRNADWAERAVREGVSVTAEEAVEQNVADFLAGSVDALLAQADGREVKLQGEPIVVRTARASVETVDPDWRSKLLAVITNPTVAYLLMMIGIYGLLLEGYNPGSIVPGTVGAICLLLALYAFQVLPVNFAGLLLILLGIILIISEALVPSFGALGFGGIVALVVGSVILMDTDVPGFEIALEVIGSVATMSGVLLLTIAWMAVKAWRSPVVSGAEEVEHASGEASTDVDANDGWVYITGERWHALSERPIRAGQRIRVLGRDGLTVRVEPMDSTEEQ